MSMAMDLRNSLLNAVFVSGYPYTSLATVYLALYYTTLDETQGTESEIGFDPGSGDGYARQAVTFSAPVDGITSNTTDITLTTTGADWYTIVAAAIVTGSSGGNRMYYHNLSVPINVKAGKPVTIKAGDLKVSIN